MVLNREYSYDKDGAITGIRNSQLGEVTRYEFAYGMRGLTNGFSHIYYGGAVRTHDNCEDTIVPMTWRSDRNVWKYRYNGTGGREQKRLYYSQYADSCKMHPWVYYLLDIGNGTRAIWHGRQTMVNTACESGGVRRVVFYPVEYRGAGTAYIRRAGGGWEKEHRISDYLGSQRLALKPSGMSSLNFGIFGEIGTSSTRPGYIGKEKDGESQTGDYGARHYDELSGRFLSVDPLWASFPDQTPYQYGYNNPVMYRDPSGMSNEKPINGSSKGGGSHTCSRCGQPKNNNDNDSPLNPGNHICGGGTQFGSSDAYAARINSEFSALANKNSGETSGGRTMVIGGEKVESGSGGRSGKNGNKNPPAALSAKTGRGNSTTNNPSDSESESAEESKRKWEKIVKEGHAIQEENTVFYLLYGLLSGLRSLVIVSGSLTRTTTTTVANVAAKEVVKNELKFSMQQVWKKFGEHFREFGLPHSKEGYQQYLKIAQEVFENPTIKHIFPEGGKYAGETWLINNGRLLRLDPQGNFRSLYMLNQ